MQLTRHADYALRLLIYLAGEEAAEGGQGAGGRSQIATVATAQAISRTHLMKIANGLARAGFLASSRGRGGGIALARPADRINLGEVIEAMEPRCPLVDCSSCQLVGRCSLPGVLDEADRAFRAVLARYTLADICRGPVGPTPV
jgi:Rrf2 family transcriptional regulator, nitric oxide-sensitive transcriptional repressor